MWKKKLFNTLLFVTIFALLSVLFNRCYKEEIINPGIVQSLNLLMTEEQQLKAWESRGIKYDIDNPKPTLVVNDEVYRIKKIGLRGQSALNYSRKCYKLSLYEPLSLVNESIVKDLYDFSLISMVNDYTYIENLCSFGILKKLNLFPLFYRLTELKINGQSQGLYLLIEDPESYALDDVRSEFVMRRGYNHSIDNYDFKPHGSVNDEGIYFNRYYSIYSSVVTYDSVALYDTLSGLFNLSMYMRKMVVENLLTNGDYTDEVYFYADPKNYKFEIIPWDYDDVFSELPHEIGQDWGIGTLFGQRSYHDLSDKINDIGMKPIFSIEDDLDYKIAKDTFLYGKYLEELASVLLVIDDIYINQHFNNIERDLNPYYEVEDIIEMSKYDNKPTDKELLKSNLNEKKNRLLSRLQEMRNYVSH